MTNMGYQSSREELLAQVNQAGFSALDTGLFLDTHPCDAAALSYMNEAIEAYESAKSTYEAQFGPLTMRDSRDTSYWSWVNDPWPWEGGNY